MELNFKEFMLNELFDSSVEEIDWGNSSGQNWMGIFFVPTKGMNSQGALTLRQKQKVSGNPWVAPPGHTKFQVNIKIDFAPSRYLATHYDANSFDVNGLGKGHLLAQVNFKRHSGNGATFERPDQQQRNPDENLVFGTVRKAVEDVISRSGANVTGILFVSHQDADPESAGKRLKTYKLLAKTVGSRHGFVQVPALHDETNILLIKKEFIGHIGSQKWPNALTSGPVIV